ncbi:uncharacterized protein LOC144581770 [Callithrix jacchus]
MQIAGAATVIGEEPGDPSSCVARSNFSVPEGHLSGLGQGPKRGPLRRRRQLWLMLTQPSAPSLSHLKTEKWPPRGRSETERSISSDLHSKAAAGALAISLWCSVFPSSPTFPHAQRQSGWPTSEEERSRWVPPSPSHQTTKVKKPLGATPSHSPNHGIKEAATFLGARPGPQKGGSKGH